MVLVLPAAILAGALTLFEPLAQPLSYHDFADRRPFAGIPNFADVATNLAFLISGGLGLLYCLKHRLAGARLAWAVFFSGYVLVAFASSYYHWNPNNGTLVWDRGAMTVGFMGVYAALIAEYVSAGLERRILIPAVFAGIASVLYWHWVDDLRPYFALQAAVFATAATILACFESPYRQKAPIAMAFAAYAVAIAFDFMDRQIFTITGGLIGGHALKHILAGLAGYLAYRILVRRTEAGGPENVTG